MHTHTHTHINLSYKGHSNEKLENCIKFIMWNSFVISLWRVSGTVTCSGINLSQQLKENSMVCCLLVCLQHDNAQRHTAGHNMKHLQHLKLKVLPHLPHLPQLTACGSHLFWPLKDTLHGRHFRSFEVVKEAVHNWPAQQPTRLPRNLWGFKEGVKNMVGTTLKINVNALYLVFAINHFI
jgi:hypothetical protein